MYDSKKLYNMIDYSMAWLPDEINTFVGPTRQQHPVPQNQMKEPMENAGKENIPLGHAYPEI